MQQCDFNDYIIMQERLTKIRHILANSRLYSGVRYKVDLLTDLKSWFLQGLAYRRCTNDQRSRRGIMRCCVMLKCSQLIGTQSGEYTQNGSHKSRRSLILMKIKRNKRCMKSASKLFCKLRSKSYLLSNKKDLHSSMVDVEKAAWMHIERVRTQGKEAVLWPVTPQQTSWWLLNSHWRDTQGGGNHLRPCWPYMRCILLNIIYIIYRYILLVKWEGQKNYSTR